MAGILEAARLPTPLLTLVKEYMSRASVSINTKHGLCRPLPVTNGVPQGGTLSPPLFKIAVDVLSHRLGEMAYERIPGVGIPTPAGIVSHTLYADDLACLATSATALHLMLQEVKAVGARVGLSINPAKSGVIIITTPKVRVWI